MPINYRTYDAFSKPVKGIRPHTALGGVITLIAATSASLLFFLQLYLYVRPNSHQSLHISESFSTKLLPNTSEQPYNRKSLFPINIKITFPHLKCTDIDVTNDDARGPEFEKMHKHSILRKVEPSKRDLNEFDPDFATNNIRPENGCTISGELLVPKVGGTLAFSLSAHKWKQIQISELFQLAKSTIIHGPEDYDKDVSYAPAYNVSHYIHRLEFGNTFPLASNPLKKSRYIFKHIGLSNVAVKIIPTKYKTSIFFPTQNMHQISVTQHTLESSAFLGDLFALPGLSITYDFTPIMVQHETGRDTLFTFLTNLVSIVGGVFVTVELVSGFLITGAAAVAKKMD